MVAVHALHRGSASNRDELLRLSDLDEFPDLSPDTKPSLRLCFLSFNGQIVFNGTCFLRCSRSVFCVLCTAFFICTVFPALLAGFYVGEFAVFLALSF